MPPTRWLRRLRPAGVLLAATLPWSWFVLRDVLGDVGDVLAILLVPIVVIGVVVELLLAARRHRWWLAVAASTLLFGATAVVTPWLPAPTGPVTAGRGLDIVSANIEGGTDPVPALLTASPDVLVVAEMTAAAEPLLDPRYRYRVVALDGPSVAVYSRFPMRVLDRPSAVLPGLRVEITGPAGPFVLYGLHVPRPWFSGSGGYQATVGEHHAIVSALAARVTTETLPTVLAGDLNSPDRGRDYRLLDTTMTDVMRESPTSWTSTGKWVPLLVRIDHIFVTPGWCGAASHHVALPGSDHNGVAATIGPCG